MKKYIKTQAGIYEIKNGKFLGNFDVEKYSKDFPVRFADTIEELCDEFVIKVGVHNIVLHDLDSALYYVKDFKNHELVKDYEIYGAIWVSIGLKYAAALNSDDELELIPSYVAHYYTAPSIITDCEIKVEMPAKTEDDGILKTRFETAAIDGELLQPNDLPKNIKC